MSPRAANVKCGASHRANGVDNEAEAARRVLTFADCFEVKPIGARSVAQNDATGGRGLDIDGVIFKYVDDTMVERAPRSNRRARKRRENRKKVVQAAMELFERQGYGGTTMEDVAAHADVGVGTLYNYFGSKEGLLLGVFEDAAEPLLVAGQRLVEEPGPDAESALLRMIEVFEPLGTMFKKPVLREMFAAALVQPSERVEEFASLDVKFAAALGALVVKLAAQGAVSAEVDVEAAAIALYGALTVPLLMFLSVDAMDSEALRALVRRQVHVVFTGLAPRERTGNVVPPRPKRRSGR